MKTNVNLKTYNSFGFDAVAKEFVEINDANELQTLIRRGQLKNKDVLVLSGGNNILFTKEVFDGIVVYMNNKGIKRSCG
jgi:UDP-N-acetylmuramate dehydrogenase